MYAPPAAHCASPSTARDVFADDRTRFSFAELAGDPEPIANLVVARHRAWRVMGPMKHIVDTLPFGTDVGTMAGLLRGATQELEEAKLAAIDCTGNPETCQKYGRSWPRLDSMLFCNDTALPSDERT